VSFGKVRGRYAPSPSGDLHLGNARTALIAWWHVRSLGGAFVLRIEDLDPDRSKAEAAAGIIDDLAWLGIDWDEGPGVGGPYGPYAQSERRDLYDAALKSLLEQGRVYPCWCTRAEVRAAASAPHGDEGRLFRYPGTCRPDRQQVGGPDRLGAKAQTTLPWPPPLRDGRAPALRYKAGGDPIRFSDEFAGEQFTDLAREIGDFVVRRSDGVAAYHLAVAVDDAAQRITHVVRGGDLLQTTACQIELARALGYTPPRYAHVPLVVDKDGRRLAKRKGDLTLRALRSAGVRPGAITGWLAWTCGLIDEPAPVAPAELVPAFSLSKIRKAPAVVTEDVVALLRKL